MDQKRKYSKLSIKEVQTQVAGVMPVTGPVINPKHGLIYTKPEQLLTYPI